MKKSFIIGLLFMAIISVAKMNFMMPFETTVESEITVTTFLTAAIANGENCVGSSEGLRRIETGSLCLCNGQYVVSQKCVLGSSNCSPIKCS